MGYAPSFCHRVAALRRWARAVALHWIAAGAVIDEARDAPLDESEIEKIAEAIERSREAGR